VLVGLVLLTLCEVSDGLVVGTMLLPLGEALLVDLLGTGTVVRIAFHV
jgi:hypothetical protein